MTEVFKRTNENTFTVKSLPLRFLLQLVILLETLQNVAGFTMKKINTKDERQRARYYILNSYIQYIYIVLKTTWKIEKIRKLC